MTRIPPVTLVGAGPGDPRLTTLAGVDALRAADVVLHDRLIAHQLLDLAPDAELIDVGKMPDGPATPQRRIHELMVERARRGQRVVRLKGGDPFVFGRGGEEASALAEAGVPVVVVPGVSSATAAAAAAGIAVTDRRAASAVTIVTGSEGDAGAPPIDWDAVARVGGTIVLLMGWRNLDDIAARLTDAGLPADTPAAAIASAWTPAQWTVFAPLGELAREASELRPPVTVVIGEVTALAATDLARGVTRPRVLVTRAAHQAETFAEQLRARGIEPVLLPAIAIEPTDAAPIDDAVQQLADGRYDIVALTSVNGVGRLWQALERAGLDARAFAGTRVAAIGSETARALAERGIQPDTVPSTFTTDALAEALTHSDLSGRRVLLARAAEGNPGLAERLREAGAEVDDVALYRTVTPAPDAFALSELARGVDLVTLTSPSTARGFVALASADAASSGGIDLHSLQCVCIGPVTAEAARELGLAVAAVAEPHTIAGLLQAVERALNRDQP